MERCLQHFKESILHDMSTLMAVKLLSMCLVGLKHQIALGPADFSAAC